MELGRSRRGGLSGLTLPEPVMNCETSQPVQAFAVRRVTAARASGAITTTTGNANYQAVSQALVHAPMNPWIRPVAWTIEMPEASKDISPARISPNSNGANF